MLARHAERRFFFLLARRLRRKGGIARSPNEIALFSFKFYLPSTYSQTLMSNLVPIPYEVL